MIEADLDEGTFDFSPVASEHHHYESVYNNAYNVAAQYDISIVNRTIAIDEAYQLK